MQNQLLTTVREQAAILFKYKGMIHGLVFLTVLLTAAFVYILPEHYAATAKLLVKPGRQNAAPPSIIQRTGVPTVYTANLRREDINSEVEILRNDVLVREAIAAVGPETLSPPLVRGEGTWGLAKYYLRVAWRTVAEEIQEILYVTGLSTRTTQEQKLFLAVQGRLTVTEVRNTDIIAITFTWPMPQPAAQFVNTLMDRYRAYHIRIHQDLRIQEFLNQEVTEAERRLSQRESSLHELRASTGITSPTEQRSLLLGREASIEAEIAIARAKTAEAGTRMTILERQIAAESQRMTVGGGSTIQQALRKQYLDLEADLLGTSERRKFLESDLAAVRARLNRLDEQEIRLQQLVRQRDLEAESYVLYRKRQEEASLSAGMDTNQIVDVVVVAAAEVPARPVRFISFLPPKIFKILVALVGSFVIAILLAFVRHHADYTLDTKRKVEKYTGLQVLGSIPRLARA